MTTTGPSQVPQYPYDRFLAANAEAIRNHRSWTRDDGALPALYLGHGAPPLLDDMPWMTELFTWAQALPKPKAVLMVSAHWESAPLAVSSSDADTPLVYDFGGFDERFYRMTYPTPDASDLARRVAATMPDSEPLHQHRSRGLDHGAWVPMKVMYPLGDVPTLQLSIPTHRPDRLLAIGKRLAELRQEGVLVVGSGFLTHGLPFLSRDNFFNRAPAPTWSVDFDAWAKQALDAGDVETLAAYHDKAPGMPYAHPTPEHFSPLFVTIGSAADPHDPVDTTIEGFFFGLAKRSFQVA